MKTIIELIEIIEQFSYRDIIECAFNGYEDKEKNGYACLNVHTGKLTTFSGKIDNEENFLALYVIRHNFDITEMLDGEEFKDISDITDQDIISYHIGELMSAQDVFIDSMIYDLEGIKNKLNSEVS